jgi:hypothetical protein
MWQVIKNFFDLLLNGAQAYHRIKGDPVVVADDSGLSIVKPEKESKQFLWSEVNHVGILTTSDGPFFDDVFFIIRTDQTAVCIALGDAVKIQLLSYFEKFPGFKWDKAVEAMTYTTEASFECWDRGWQMDQNLSA